MSVLYLLDRFKPITVMVFFSARGLTHFFPWYYNFSHPELNLKTGLSIKIMISEYYRNGNISGIPFSDEKQYSPVKIKTVTCENFRTTFLELWCILKLRSLSFRQFYSLYLNFMNSIWLFRRNCTNKLQYLPIIFLQYSANQNNPEWIKNRNNNT